MQSTRRPYFGAGPRVAASAFSRASIFACIAVSCARSAPTLKNTSFCTGASSLAALPDQSRTKPAHRGNAQREAGMAGRTRAGCCLLMPSRLADAGISRSSHRGGAGRHSAERPRSRAPGRPSLRKLRQQPLVGGGSATACRFRRRARRQMTVCPMCCQIRSRARSPLHRAELARGHRGP
jgi:hypothetical protein